MRSEQREEIIRAKNKNIQIFNFHQTLIEVRIKIADDKYCSYSPLPITESEKRTLEL